MTRSDAAGIVIAIDGPAASGKSSTARAVAAELGYHHLDSGAFYRAITLAALDAGIPAESWHTLTAEDLRDLQVDAEARDHGFAPRIAGVDVGDRIRSASVNAHVSRMAAIPTVRDWLLQVLRETGEIGGLVADGRDIGTVVFPNASLKVFLVCDAEERARRRLREQGETTPSRAALGAETRRLIERDRQDQSRASAPLVRAPDAVVLDTTDLSFDAQVRTITRLARVRAGA